MFWRIEFRLLKASRGRLAVALLALASGAAITAALLSLQLDASRKLTREFRAFGANVVVSASKESSAPAAARATTTAMPAENLLDAAIVSRVPTEWEGQPVAAVPFLYFIADAKRVSSDPIVAISSFTTLVVAGTRLSDLPRIAPGWTVTGRPVDAALSSVPCLVGTKAAEELGVVPGGVLRIRVGEHEGSCIAQALLSAGGPEDDQLFLPLPAAQELAGLPGRISLVQISVPGSAAGIARFVSQLSARIPGAQVRPVRQLAEAEAALYARIHGLLLAIVVLILFLTILCVMTAMTTLALERKRDVGLMKMLGGRISRVLQLFLVEAGTLGLAGGLLGSVAGLLLSQWLGKRVFGVAATPRWEILPLTAALMVVVAIAGAFPLRLLARVKPAVIFRGEA
jgi:putative ABC transport system permease protein